MNFCPSATVFNWASGVFHVNSPFSTFGNSTSAKVSPYSPVNVFTCGASSVAFTISKLTFSPNCPL